MLRDELIELVGWRLGNRKGLGERITAELLNIQRNVLEQNEWLPWFLETELAETSTVAGEQRIPLPTDYLMEVEESALYLRDGELSGELVKGDYDLLRRKYPSPGRPVAYCLVGSYFQLFPKPDAVYALEMRYYGQDAPMSVANVETKWLKYAADLVLALVCSEIAGKHLRDAAQAAVFQPDISKAWARLYAADVAKREVNRSRVMGGAN